MQPGNSPAVGVAHREQILAIRACPVDMRMRTRMHASHPKGPLYHPKGALFCKLVKKC